MKTNVNCSVGKYSSLRQSNISNANKRIMPHTNDAKFKFFNLNANRCLVSISTASIM